MKAFVAMLMDPKDPGANEEDVVMVDVNAECIDAMESIDVSDESALVEDEDDDQLGSMNTPSVGDDDACLVNFIQVCRNDARPVFRDMFSVPDLEWLYRCACACYCYQNCPAIDLYAPVSVVLEGRRTYVPLVVSVKTRRYISPSQIASSLEEMGHVIEGNEHKAGFCLLMVIGLDLAESKTSGFCTTKGAPLNINVESISPLKSGQIYNIIVFVPSKDVFGLSDVVKQTTVGGSQLSEVFASHPFLHAYAQRSDKGYEKLLRCNADPNVVSYCKTLCQALKQAASSDQPINANDEGEEKV
jgi:hypothetical protein